MNIVRAKIINSDFLYNKKIYLENSESLFPQKVIEDYPNNFEILEITSSDQNSKQNIPPQSEKLENDTNSDMIKVSAIDHTTENASRLKTTKSKKNKSKQGRNKSSSV